jgi:biotin operon repressor
MNKALLLLKIIYMLKQGTYTALQVGQTLGISHRYVQDLISVIRQSGIIVESKSGAGNGYSIPDHRIIVSPDLWKDATKEAPGV